MLLEQLDRGRVRPVQVFECDNEWPLFGQPREQRLHNFERPPLQGLRRQLRRPSRRVALELEVEQRARYG